MRSPKSRSRNKNNNNRNRSGVNVVNRVFDSSGPEGKVRGTPQQIIEKYAQLARDSQLSNDRVAAENFQQHGEHYIRLLGEAQREMDAKREQQERERQQNREAQQTRHENQQPRRDDPQPRRDENQPRREDNAAQPDPAYAEQPDLVDRGAPQESALVATPENPGANQEPKPKRKPRVRKPKVEQPAEPEASSDKPETPEAAE